VTALKLASFAAKEHSHLGFMSITPIELKARIDRGENFRLIDVREADEWAVARLPRAELIPLSQFQQLAAQELSPDETLILYCHHGIRSGRAQGYLKAQGYANVLNLTGGIDAWALQVEPTMKRY
jgi:rhodanese-related sulfurtransferase